MDSVSIFAYNVLFRIAAVIFAVQLASEAVHWLLKKRKQKLHKSNNEWPAKYGDNHAETDEQCPGSFRDLLDDIKTLLYCTISFLVIIGGAVFAAIC